MLETDNLRQVQAAEEAIELLRRAGFRVNELDVSTTGPSASFELDLELSLDEATRPLAEQCERDDCEL